MVGRPRLTFAVLRLAFVALAGCGFACGVIKYLRGLDENGVSLRRGLFVLFGSV